jgi:zinc-finger of acetyl-transferase ESCO
MKTADEQRGITPCPVCKFNYVPGLPGEARQHAAFHARYMWQRKPKPEPRLRVFGGDVRVDAESPGWLQRIVYRCAVGLQRDEGYDFPQWREDGPPEPSANGRDSHALLLVENTNIPVGAVSFVWVDWPDYKPGWHMSFVWVGDAWRRKGVLTRRWPAWRSTYGDFTLARPLSEAMRAFVAKTDPERANPPKRKDGP